MSSRERDLIDRLFGEFLQTYAEVRPPADAWQAIERRLQPSVRFGLDWRGWLKRFSSARGIGLDILMTPTPVSYGRELGGAGAPLPFILMMTAQQFSFRGAF